MHLKKLLNQKILISIILFQILIIIGLKAYHDQNIIQQVKSRIENEYPEIKDPNISDIKKLHLLREWTSAHVVWGSDSTNMNYELSRKNLYKIFETFDKSEGSVNCGLVSYILMKIYEEYGFEAYTYHSGSLDAFNHAVTFVKVNHNNKEILMIEDASFDLTFMDKNGNPYDFFDFIKTIKKGDKNNIVISQGNGKPHFYLCNLSNDCNKPAYGTPVIKVSSNKIKFPEKFTTYTIKTNMDIFLINRGVFASAKWKETEPIKNKLRAILN
jgi:hypothetical protein